MRRSANAGKQFVVALLLLTAVSIGLQVALSITNGELMDAYLLWNVSLAWLPLIFTIWLIRTLRHKLWSSWEGLAATTFWLIFLPNSFYMISDFIHLNELGGDQLLFGAVTFTAFVLTSLCLGIASLYMIHAELLKRVSSRTAAVLVGVLLLIVSLAIYVGRDLRWNSWDVITNPFGLLFDISERLLHPNQYGQIVAVALPFFVLLAMVYFVVYSAARAIQEK